MEILFLGITTINNVEVFNRNVMNWQRAPSLNIDRSAAAACVMNNSATITACAQNGEFYLNMNIFF